MGWERRKNRTLLVKIQELDSSTRSQMWKLFERYYSNVTRDKFDQDLDKKSHVILLFDRDKETLFGFSSLLIFSRQIGRRSVVVLFSGDTIVDRRYWGRLTLQKAWFSFAIRLKLKNLFNPVYWYLITKGYKTYLLLSRNFSEYWPRHDRPTPPRQAEVIRFLSREMFKDEFNERSGVVCHGPSGGSLKEGVADVNEDERMVSDIRFFLEKNPGYQNGDELCCIGLINFKMIGKGFVKMITKSLDRGDRS